ncbi:MAG: class I SAM-dependent RNA methyltransferase, partial [Calditrichaeota bacterium]|nr:class I SAM-dependent RNA methyltransferase [Calditrichota bacterium]
RILLRLGSFYAGGFPELKRKVRRLPWADMLTPKTHFELRVTCHKSRLYHSGAVAERVADAIHQQCGAQPVPAGSSADDEGGASQLIVVRLLRDHCTVSIDTSGEGLHRRGYRQATAKAPLRETLAAAMLLAAGWDDRAPLLDPFCGSGTIAIEAALLARHLAPGLQRRFAFMDWPDFR